MAIRLRGSGSAYQAVQMWRLRQRAAAEDALQVTAMAAAALAQAHSMEKSGLAEIAIRQSYQARLKAVDRRI